jgi:probable phosphoglycerate mutase
MLLYIVRHADPVYHPDSLTPLGLRQAEALSRRFSRCGLDRVYTSPQWRARLTARPTCECLKIEPAVEEWMAELRAFRRFSMEGADGRRRWMFQLLHREMFLPENACQSRENWFEAPMYAKMPNIRRDYEELAAESDEFMARLGFVREGALYRLTGPDPGRVAAFCHAGFGGSWLSHLLYMPPQLFWRSFDLNLSSVTVLSFRPEEDGLCSPQCVAFSDLSHLYAEGLPVRYLNREFF